MNIATKLGIGFAVLAIGFGVIVILKPNSTPAQTLGAETRTLQPYTATEVSKHKSKTDCWTIINDNVYDLTGYIPHHQGGDNILSACGVDGTAFFNGQKAGAQGDTKRHAGSANAELAKLQIGTLAQ